MSFGKWYEEQKAGEEGGDGGNNWFGGLDVGLNSDQLLPLYEGMQPINFQNIRASMEAQMPKKILGMGYQQRFKVSNLSVDFEFITIFRPAQHLYLIVLKRSLQLYCCFRPSSLPWHLVLECQ